MRLLARVESVEFSGLTDSGFLIGPDGFKGWDTSTPTKRQVVDIPWAHGAYAIRGFRDTRIVTISGTCLADSEARLGWYRSQLMGLLADGDVGQIAVEHSGVTMFAPCYLDDEPQFDVFAAGAAATFSVKFWCPDPRKFGDTRTFASGDTAFHYGNFSAAPVHTVTGANAAGYTLNGPGGAKYVVTQPLVAGHPHVIDMATGFLSIDGVVISGGITQADLWLVGPGQQVVQTITGAGAVLSTTVTDTYI